MHQQVICTDRERPRVQDEYKDRIALGVYDDFTLLKSTLEEFEAFGLDLASTVIVANPGGLGGRLEAELPTLDVCKRTTMPRLLIRANSPDGAIKLADFASSLTGYRPTEQLLHFDGWITGSLSNDLNSHLANGSCVLVAPITTADLEWRVSNTLLKHSASRVQLHDLSSPH
jgi:hypothetical protein